MSDEVARPRITGTYDPEYRRVSERCGVHSPFVSHRTCHQAYPHPNHPHGYRNGHGYFVDWSVTTEELAEMKKAEADEAAGGRGA